MMTKAKQFIQNYTRDYSNVNVGWNDNGEEVTWYSYWLSPDDALRAVEIEREETLKEVKKKLLNMLQISVDNSHFFEQLDDYIEKLKTSNER